MIFADSPFRQMAKSSISATRPVVPSMSGLVSEIACYVNCPQRIRVITWTGQKSPLQG